MTTFELIQLLAKYPANTEVKMASNWDEPQLSESYLDLDTGPVLALHTGEMENVGERIKQELEGSR